ncbi:MAG: glycosyltransferase, partial [Calditrichaeota bacterium]
VSVLITTYNHEAYIEQCLQGVLAQQTDFDFQILLGEDESSDGTLAICERYAGQYPEKIKLFRHRRRDVVYIDGQPTGRRNFVNLLSAANTPYIARCEGDDYWTDAHKLQTLVDFLEKNPDFSVAFHRVQWLKDGTLQEEPSPPPAGRDEFTVDDLFAHDNFIRTSAVVYRNVLNGRLPEWIFSVPYGDITFHLLHAQQGKIKYFDRVMGVYRVHGSGRYSAESTYLNLSKAIMTYRLLARHLGRTESEAFRRGQARLLRAAAQAARHEADRLEQETPPAVQGDPLVSVIVPTYNRPQGLRLALQSLARQTYPHLEVVVVNDAGQDVQAVLDEFKDGLQIKYIVHQQNKDLAGARNTGLRHASGDYIAYLDDDDLFFPNHLEEALRVLTNSDYQVVYSEALCLHQQAEAGLYRTQHVDLPYRNEFDRDRLLLHNLFPVLSVVHSRHCLEKAGYFDESLHTHEDWDFFIRLSRHFDFFHLKKVTCAFSKRYDAST